VSTYQSLSCTAKRRQAAWLSFYLSAGSFYPLAATVKGFLYLARKRLAHHEYPTQPFYRFTYYVAPWH